MGKNEQTTTENPCSQSLLWKKCYGQQVLKSLFNSSQVLPREQMTLYKYRENMTIGKKISIAIAPKKKM